MRPIVEKNKVIFDDDCREILSFYLKIVEYGWVITDTNNDYGEKFAHLHRLNYILSGRPYYDFHGRRIELQPGCLVYLGPNERLGVTEGEPVNAMFINFQLGAADKFNRFARYIGKVFVHNHIHDEEGRIREIMEGIFKTGRRGERGAGLEMQNLFVNLFLMVTRQHPAVKSHPEAGTAKGTVRFFNSAVRYINSRISQEIKIREIAENLHISENYLYKIFMEKTGVSPSAFIQNYRMDLAEHQLKNTRQTVKEISRGLGYNSLSHFGAVFKKRTGMTPAQYRRAQRDEDSRQAVDLIENSRNISANL